MAMKFGDATLDRMVRECFRPAVERTGFDLRVLTDQQAAGLIDDQIRAALLSARFVIADLTHGSHGAYWEAGFGEGRGIPVIYTCEKSAWEQNKSHFDTSHGHHLVGLGRPGEDCRCACSYHPGYFARGSETVRRLVAKNVSRVWAAFAKSWRWAVRLFRKTLCDFLTTSIDLGCLSDDSD